jgi:hypothetical protein
MTGDHMMKFAFLAGALGWLFSGDWLIGACLLVLGLGWVMLQPDEGPPVIALAFSMQWLSVCVGLFYFTLTDRPLDATIHSDYRPMVEIGLGCLVAMITGLAVGRRLVGLLGPASGLRPAYALTFKTLVTAYALGTLFVGAIQTAAWDYPGLAQAILALTYLRLGLLYLVLRRLLADNQWHFFGAVVAVEIVLGITGYYAGFREPLIMAALSFLEFFDRRNVRHWITISALVTLMAVLGIAWVGVRTEYRRRFESDEKFAANRSARIDVLRASINDWAGQSRGEMLGNLDRFVDRMWTIYYPALAVSRVPSVLPHTNGSLMLETLQYVFEPRLFFPNKPDIKSDSEMVRKYSGVWVAGEDQLTDIAFGYAAESYIDFGIPLMFVPTFIWSAFVGFAIACILRVFRHRDIAISVATVIAWLSLYLFERSWAKTIGLSGTLLIYAGGLSFILDRLWFEKFRNIYGKDLSDADSLAEEPLQLPAGSK